MMSSMVSRPPAADAARALNHFKSLLEYETDCWDVHHAIAHGRQDFVLLDVRGEESHDDGHIDGAVSLPHTRINEETLSGYPVCGLLCRSALQCHREGGDSAGLPGKAGQKDDRRDHRLACRRLHAYHGMTAAISGCRWANRADNLSFRRRLRSNGLPGKEIDGMDKSVVRPIEPRDAAAIAQLWLICAAEVAKNEPIYMPDISAARLTGMLQDEFAHGSRFGWVAEKNGKLAGYVICQLREEAPVFVPRRYLYVHHLDVAPAYRGRRLSHKLMQAVEQHALSIGIDRLELAVVFRDPRSRAVWEKHGFHPHVVHLHKKLD
jgi:GNAT superfamily N-acetyltransferase